jgi:hypothetical protein
MNDAAAETIAEAARPAPQAGTAAGPSAELRGQTATQRVEDPVAPSSGLRGQTATQRVEDPVDVSVVVYVDDYLDNAAQIYAYVANALRALGRRFEFVFVDDGSAGRTAAETEAIQALVRGARLIRLPRCFGTGSAMSAGFQHARGRLVLTLGSFLQVEPREVEKMFRKIEEGYDFVNGWRVDRTDSRWNRLQSRLYNGMVRLLSRVDLHDTNCTLKLFRREIVDELPLHGELYRFLPVLAARQGFLVAEVPVSQRREINRSGFYSPATYVRRGLDLLVLLFVGRFAATPLRFFGVIGAALLAAGLAVNGWLTWAKLAGGEAIADRPLLLLGVMLVVVGVQVLSVGLVGELVIFTHAKQLRGYRIEKVVD